MPCALIGNGGRSTGEDVRRTKWGRDEQSHKGVLRIRDGKGGREVQKGVPCKGMRRSMLVRAIPTSGS